MKYDNDVKKRLAHNDLTQVCLHIVNGVLLFFVPLDDRRKRNLKMIVLKKKQGQKWLATDKFWASKRFCQRHLVVGKRFAK